MAQGRARLLGAERGSEVPEGIPGRAPDRQGCTGWVQSRSSPGATAAPQSRWMSQSRWRPAGRGLAPESQRRVAPPQIPRPEETGRKEAGQSWAWLDPSRDPLTQDAASLNLWLPLSEARFCQATKKCKAASSCNCCTYHELSQALAVQIPLPAAPSPPPLHSYTPLKALPA